MVVAWKFFLAFFMTSSFVFVVMMTIKEISWGRASCSWPTTNGQVLRSFVAKNPSGEHGHAAFVTYQYTVEGQEYESSTIRFPLYSGYNYSKAKKIISAYPVLKTVKVYYNPKKPLISVLIPGVRLIDYVSSAFTCLCFGLFALVMLSWATGKPTWIQPLFRQN